MCTVTYVPSKSGFILTSNRDESPLRETYDPDFASTGSYRSIYPRDVKAGGTWFGVNNATRCVCLLNGALNSHDSNERFAVSRGLIVLELLSCNEPLRLMSEADLAKVKPFTIIVASAAQTRDLNQFIWDGMNLTHTRLNGLKAHIWSSTSLYDARAAGLRSQWFNNWIVKYCDHDDFNISLFHRFCHTDDDSIDLIMNRENRVRTVSITQAVTTSEHLSLRYYNLITGYSGKYRFDSQMEFKNAV